MAKYGKPENLYFGVALFNRDIITKYVFSSSGTYALGKKVGNEFKTMYVGRGEDLERRLKSYLDKREKGEKVNCYCSKYSHFCYDYFNAKEAYEAECVLFHEYDGQLKNENHPKVDDEDQNWKCPVKNVGCCYA